MQLNKGVETAKKRIITAIPREAIAGQEFVIKGSYLGVDPEDIKKGRTGRIEINGYHEDGIWGSFGSPTPIRWTDNEIAFIVPTNLETDRNYSVIVTIPVSGRAWVESPQMAVPNDFYLLPDFVWYEVKPKDSLFKIAQQQLGAEGRYLEILTLNKTLYPDLDVKTPLGVGMRLRLPKK